MLSGDRALGEHAAPAPALPDPKRHRSIRFRLTLLVLVCVLPVWVTVGFFAYHSYQQKRRAVAASVLETARALSLAVDRELANMQASMKALATSPSLSLGDMAAFHRQAQSVLRDYPGGDIILADASGQQLVNSFVPFGKPLPSRNLPEAVRGIYRDGKPVTSDLFRGAVTGRPLISVDVPVFRGGQVIYDLALTVPAESLLRVIPQEGVSPEWTLTIHDTKGVVVARNRSPERHIGTGASSELRTSLSQGREGFTELTNDEGVAVIATISRSVRTGWSAVVDIPRRWFITEVWHSLWWAVCGTVLLSVIGVGLALLLARRIAGSIRALIVPALALGRGDPVELGRLDLEETHEVGQSLLRASELVQERAEERERAVTARQKAEELEHRNVELRRREADAQAHASELSAIIQERKRAEEELRLSEEKFAKAFARSPAAIALTRFEDGLFLDVNDTWVTLSGYSRDESIGHSAREMGLWPNPATVDRFIEELREKGSLHWQEQNFLNKAGKVFLAEISAQVITVCGRRLVLSTLVDITARKEAMVRAGRLEAVRDFSRRLLTVREEEKRQLAAALHHDLGSMAVSVGTRLDAVEESLREIQALLRDREDDSLRQQSNEALLQLKEGSRFFHDSVRHLGTLARQLRPPDLDVVGLTAALRQHALAVTRAAGLELRYLDTTRGKVLPTEIQTVIFRTAQECLNNVVKHAQASKVRIRLSVQRRRIRLSIADDGRGFDYASVTSRPDSHLGLRIMQEMVAVAEGSFDVLSKVNRGTAVVVTISLPVADKRKTMAAKAI